MEFSRKSNLCKRRKCLFCGNQEHKRFHRRRQSHMHCFRRKSFHFIFSFELNPYYFINYLAITLSSSQAYSGKLSLTCVKLCNLIGFVFLVFIFPPTSVNTFHFVFFFSLCSYSFRLVSFHFPPPTLKEGVPFTFPWAAIDAFTCTQYEHVHLSCR